MTLANEFGDEQSQSLYRYDPRRQQYSIPDYRLAAGRGNMYWKLPESVNGNKVGNYAVSQCRIADI